MAELLILWGYMFLINGCIGAAVLKGACKLSRKDGATSGWTGGIDG